MKKRIISLLTAVVFVFTLFSGLTASFSAAEPHTYTVKYIPEKSEWRVQQSDSWDSSIIDANMDYLWANLQDGDSLTILGDENSPVFGDLKIENKLSNLTLDAVTSGIILYAQQNISEIYVINGTTASLNGSYDSVYVYDNSACNVNNDVKKLIISGNTSMKMSVTALGKVDFCQIHNRGNVLCAMYNVAPGTLRVVDGENKTRSDNYSPYSDERRDEPYDEPYIAPAPAVGSSSASDKSANTLKLKGKTAAVKYSKLKKKSQKLSVSKYIKFISKGQGKLTYFKVKGNKKFSINKNSGKLTVKKGLIKDTYKIKIKVRAAGNAKYKAASKTVTAKIKIK